MMLNEISPKELHSWLSDSSKSKPLLLDVREQIEYCIAHISGAKLLPMSTIAHHLDTLPKEQPIVCYCHHGMRSFNVGQFLIQQGLKTVYNLTGGIDLWSQQIDPGVKRY